MPFSCSLHTRIAAVVDSILEEMFKKIRLIFGCEAHSRVSVLSLSDARSVSEEGGENTVGHFDGDAQRGGRGLHQ